MWRGPQTLLFLTPPTAGYPKHPRGFDQGLQGPPWAGLMGTPRADEGGWYHRARLDRTLGRRDLHAHSDQPSHPCPALSYRGSTPHGGPPRSPFPPRA